MPDSLRPPRSPDSALGASLTALFVRASGMADDTALAWLDGAHANWEELWDLHGDDVLAELDMCGHARLRDRLIELLGTPTRLRLVGGSPSAG